MVYLVSHMKRMRFREAYGLHNAPLWPSKQSVLYGNQAGHDLQVLHLAKWSLLVTAINQGPASKAAVDKMRGRNRWQGRKTPTVSTIFRYLW